MRAIIINAIDKTVFEIELPNNSNSKEWWNEMCHHLHTDILERVGLGGRVTLWVDEEGLLRKSPGPFFRFGRDPHWGPIISKHGVLLESDVDGKPKSFGYSVDFVKPLVEFLPDGWKFKTVRQKEEVIEHPILGKMNSITNNSVFEDENGNEHIQ